MLFESPNVNEAKFIKIHIFPAASGRDFTVFKTITVNEKSIIKELDSLFMGEPHLYIFDGYIVDEGKTFEEIGITNNSLLISPPKTIIDTDFLRFSLSRSISLQEKIKYQIENNQKTNSFSLRDLKLMRIENRPKLCHKIYKYLLNNYDRVQPRKNTQFKTVIPEKLDHPSIDPLPSFWDNDVDSNLCSCH